MFDVDVTGLLTRIAQVLTAASFLSGFLIAVVSTSVRAVKIWLTIIAVLGLGTTIIALMLTRNFFVFLMFQYLTVVFFLCAMVVMGAVCGYGVYLLMHRKNPGAGLECAES